MKDSQVRTMRDAVIGRIYERMCDDEKIFFLSADLGAPSLDKLRQNFKSRFINVGIAEQNLVNVATGLALEGFTVYAYAIAGFLTMRAYEQIRVNLSLLSQHRRMNVNLIGVGTGASYDVSGPSHHCFEDLTIIRTLPNIILFSPSDHVIAEKFVEFSLNVRKPKYIRLDGKPISPIYKPDTNFEWETGFYELAKGDDVCIVSTGQVTHKAMNVIKKLKNNANNVGLIDVFMLKPIDSTCLFDAVKKYRLVITVEEAFINKGGLDSMILNILNANGACITLRNFGFGDTYIFKYGDRDFLHQEAGFSERDILRVISEVAYKE
jgi:transketolase